MKTNELSFLQQHWGLVSIIVYVFIGITIFVALTSKEDFKTKITNLLLIVLLPIIGSIYYIFNRLTQKSK